jgi:hypothetical protein
VDGSEAPIALTSTAALLNVFNPRISRRGLVAFLGSQAVPSPLELYSVPLDGAQAPVKLSGQLVPGGSVSGGGAPLNSNESHWVSPDGGWVIYAGDQEVDGVLELYCAPIHGRRPALKVSGTLVPDGDVVGTSFVPGSRRIVYNADQETDDTFELFLSAFGDIDFPPPQGGSRATRAAGTPSSATLTAP